MLFAEIKGKLVPEAPGNERSEDVLTSTVFGTLFVARAFDILVKWLRCARAYDGATIQGINEIEPFNYWFWPSLAESEPDLLLRLGNILFIIEAKYLSGKHDTHHDEDEEFLDNDIDSLVTGGDENIPVSDQLVREWRSCDPNIAPTRHYSPELEKALVECRRVLIFLVSALKTRSALREFSESISRLEDARINDAEFYLLTWQDLNTVLVDHQFDELSRPPSFSWTTELCELLERRGLSSFTGFKRNFRPWLTENKILLMRFINRLPPSSESINFSSVMDDILVELVFLLSKFQRRLPSPDNSFSGFPNALKDCNIELIGKMSAWNGREALEKAGRTQFIGETK